MGTRLTRAGRRFFDRVRPIISELEAAILEAGQAGVGEDGSLDLAMISSLSTGPLRSVVESFMKAHPEVDLSISEADRSALLALLRERRIDILYAAGDIAVMADGLLLAHERVHVALPSSHPLSQHEMLTWARRASARCGFITTRFRREFSGGFRGRCRS